MFTLHRYLLPIHSLDQLQLDTLGGLRIYGSTPEAGMPPIPFQDNSVRRASDEARFKFSYSEI
jgi:hypothetical protein